MPKRKKPKDVDLIIRNILLLAFSLIIITLTLELFLAQPNNAAITGAVSKNTSLEFKPIPEENQLNDFSSTEEGVFFGQLKNSYFKEPIDEVVVLLASEKIPGLTITYYHYENKLIGGTPQMTAENVVLFDGNPHTVKYSFKMNGKQQLYYDNNLVAESDFIFHSNYLTGNIIGVNEFEISDTLEKADIS